MASVESKFALCCLLISFSFFLSSVRCFHLTLLHTNDNHGRFEQIDTYGYMCLPKDANASRCFGGMARRATMLKRIRNQESNVLLVSGGDVFTGTLWYEVYRGNATLKFMNEFAYDAMALGNHEFDDGVENLVSFLKRLNVSVVMSNVDVSQEPRWPKSPPLFTKYKVFTVGGEKVGVVGYVLESTPKLSYNPGPGPNIKFLPEVDSVRSAVEELKKQNINKIIAVGHAGIETDKKVAEVDGVDIVVGGHSNTFLYTGKAPSTEKPYGPYPLVIKPKDNPNSNVLVVQAFAYSKYLGRLDVDFDSNGQVTAWSGNPILLNSSVPQDPKVLQEVQQLKSAVDKEKVKVGESFVFLNAGKPECLLKECNLGNLITDAMVFHFSNQSANSMQWTTASIAIQNSGSITSSMDVSAQEAVNYGHIVNSLPYKKTIDIVELKGKDLLQVFEQVASKYDTKNPSSSFLQVSGIQVEYDMTKPSGQRVIAIQIRCSICKIPKYEPLNETSVYKVIMSSYLAQGGAGLSVINQKKLSQVAGNVTDHVVLMNYFSAKSPVMTGVENRISFLQDKMSICVGGGTMWSWNLPLLVVAAILASVM